jgi:pyridoxine/pyridoxamine 5'-phosphate oxidase
MNIKEQVVSLRNDSNSFEEVLLEENVDKDPFKQFEKWLSEAISSKLHEPNAMCLSTSSKEGKPSSRLVLFLIRK